MKILSWNVNGLRALHRKGQWNWLANSDADLICLQETKSTPEQLPAEVLKLTGYTSYFSSPKIKKGYSGVALYSKVEPERLEYGMGMEGLDDEGRLIVAYYKDFVLLNVYFPNGGGGLERLAYKLHFYDHFLLFIDTLHKKGHPILFCGDINTAHEEIDLARPKENETHTGFLPEERAWLDEISNHGYIDIFRYFYPNKTDAYSYWDMKSFARERNVGWRIDYFFISSDLIFRVKTIEILSNIFGSDHCPLLLVLK